MLNLLANRLSCETLIVWGLILFCLILRIGIVSLRAEELNEDPDSYIGIAQNLAAERGYSTPGTTQPTAFRPPLYPILIAPISSEEMAWARGALNVVAALGGMIFIWLAAKSLGLSRVAQLISILVYGGDPLLLRYSSLSMTETVCSMMAAMLLWRLSLGFNSQRWQSHFITGIVFGLCALTRPTFWAFAMLYGAITLMNWLFHRQGSSLPNLRQLFFMLIGALLTTSPWLVRNIVVLKSPVLMTTHGGYTILLGNNEAFYREVVEQPFGTVWDGSKGAGQAVWANGINQRMDTLGLETEISRDRWMGDLAKKTIRDHPIQFLKACWLRFLRFWNFFPSGPAMQTVPPSVYWSVGAWYSLVMICFFSGVYRILFQTVPFDFRWGACLLLIVSFTLVHLVYWSNVRMRAPVVPAVALLVAVNFQKLHINRSASIGNSESLHST